MPITVTVRSVMDDKIVTVPAEASAKEAVLAMVKNNVWSVVVKKGDEYVGVFTDRDFLRRCVAQGLDATTTPVERLMSSPLLTAGADNSLGEALLQMAQKNVRRLYVVEDGKILGRVTQTSLMQKTLDVFMTLSSL